MGTGYPKKWYSLKGVNKDMANCKDITEVDESSYYFQPTSLYVNPTQFCNLKCKHCWIEPPVKNVQGPGDDELSIEEIVDIVKEAKEMGVTSVKLTGGEPFLRKDLSPLLEFCNGSGINIVIETNGTLITKDVAEMLAKFQVAHISVSLDSASEEMHDFFRGQKGAFRKAVKGIRMLKDVGMSPQVIMSLYRENLEGFSGFIKFMEDLGIRDVKVNIICPVGRGEHMQNEELSPTVKEVLDFAERAKGMRESFRGSLYIDTPPAFKELKDIKNGKCSGCSVKNILGLLPDGSISICGIGFLDKDMIFGNIRKDHTLIKDIWRDSAFLKRVREDIPSKLEGICGKCVFRNTCLGGCRAHVYHNTGSIIAPYWFCQEAYEQGLFPETRMIPEGIRT